MRKFLILFVIISFSSQAQLTNECWTAIGIKRKINSNSELSIDINTRSYSYSFQLIYPEITYKYKFTNWFKPSIDYRLLDQRNKWGNFHLSNRLNFNLDFEKTFKKKFIIGFRIRYQSSFSRTVILNNYNPDFDPTIRLKPAFQWMPKKSKMTFNSAVEFFYNPQNVIGGHQFTKIRASAGTDINLKGPNSISIKYLYGKNINDTKYKSQHILSITYTFDWKKKKEELKNN
ncbi:MAG: DUF2490 domain-containing protein [Flavobacteriia bacterium]|nr:DUF2490 domain-containing protein [Flavobacteriia bacterium]